MIKWSATKEENETISKICDRFIEKYGSKKKDLTMDLDATHSNCCSLDFEKLLGFSEFDFYHDMFGIIRNLDRKTGKLRNCFLPRCSR